jgi:hypothetical protein
MNEQSCRATCGLVVGLVLLSLGGLGGLRAAEKAARASKRVAVGKSLTAKATILRREKPLATWKLVDKKETIYSGDLLMGMPDAQVQSRNGAVRLDFLTDLDRNSPYPIHECAVLLHDNPKVDLDVTLDRGRIDLVNVKKKGKALVHVHVWKGTWELTLLEPGAAIALELYGRWPRGVTFKPKPGPKDVPTADLILLVLKGEVEVEHGGYEHTLKAPPGPAIIEWDSASGADDAPEFVKELPAWAQPGGEKTKVAKTKKAVLERFRKAMIAKSIDEAVQDFLHSDKPADRALAVYVMGALDDLHDLGKALHETKYPDVWEHGVLALRHWIGRAPGQDLLLYDRLCKVRNYSEVDAQTTIQLLHSFGEEDLCPECYEMLIDYLEHEHLGIRGLANWHLSRLVPEGKKFGYNPLDPKKKREAAIAKWRKCIPKGKLPPRPKAKEEKEKKAQE